ncbi:DsbA family protein [Paracoccaceae bacterium Fryx2]|nr:DsbA family protein [Paracoccaceae bacterium Fryx2]
MNVTRRTLILTGSAAALMPLPAFAQEAELTVEDVLFDPDGPVLGNPEGDVTLVEYFDYQCPCCKSGHPMLMEAVARDGNIRLVMKDWPIFGGESLRATRLTLGAAEMGRFEAANAALMATKARLSAAQVDEALIGAGIDIAAATAAFAGSADKWNAYLARNMRQADSFGLAGTPAYIIGQTLYSGALTQDVLDEAIRAART